MRKWAIIPCAVLAAAAGVVRASGPSDADNLGAPPMQDLARLCGDWLSEASDANAANPADWTGDGVVNLADFAVLAGWAAGLAPDGEPVGEAATGEGGGPWEELSYLPGGVFEMGDGLGDGWADERPVHSVTVDPVRMGRCEVTNGQYCEFLNSALGQGLIAVSGGVVYQAGRGQEYPYCDTSAAGRHSQIDFAAGLFSVRSKGGRGMADDPMVAVSWYGSAAYCNWMSVQEGFEQCYDPVTWECDYSKDGYRLPTEAEWEHAARGGMAAQRFPWGDGITHQRANYWSYAGHAYDVSTTRGYHPLWNDGIEPYTSPVGSFPANGFGLYDMAGNVWEWCNDRYAVAPYSSLRVNNPRGPADGRYRVVRGGCWDSGAATCRVSFRYGSSGLYPGFRSHTGGFRIVRRTDRSGEFAVVPGGTFMMGDAIGGSNYYERPAHNVTVSSFRIGRHEITNEQFCDYLNFALSQSQITVIDGMVYKSESGRSYEYCCTSTFSSHSQISHSGNSFSVRTKGARHMANDPMVLVTWNGAVAYCNWRSEMSGKELCYDSRTLEPIYPLRNGFRLPTEAEWEYAARGGLAGKRFPWGDTITQEQANYYSTGHPDYDVSWTHGRHWQWDDGIMPCTSPVGSFPCNGYGLCDMAGNVDEWCNDWWGPYGSTPQVDPTGPRAGTYRSHRGGNWLYFGEGGAYVCRVTSRMYSPPSSRGDYLGFRVAQNF